MNVRRLLSSEKDPDVIAAIRNAIYELDHTEVAMETVSGCHRNRDFALFFALFAIIASKKDFFVESVCNVRISDGIAPNEKWFQTFSCWISFSCLNNGVPLSL